MKKSHRVAHEKSEAWWVLLILFYHFYCSCQDLIFNSHAHKTTHILTLCNIQTRCWNIILFLYSLLYLSIHCRTFDSFQIFNILRLVINVFILYIFTLDYTSLQQDVRLIATLLASELWGFIFSFYDGQFMILFTCNLTNRKRPEDFLVQKESFLVFPFTVTMPWVGRPSFLRPGHW